MAAGVSIRVKRLNSIINSMTDVHWNDVTKHDQEMVIMILKALANDCPIIVKRKQNDH